MSPIARRRFLKNTGLATGAFLFGAPAIVRGQNLNSRINVAVIGVGGKGKDDIRETAAAGGNIVALCDVDARTLGEMAVNYPEARKFVDFRKMLTEMKDSTARISALVDAVKSYSQLDRASLQLIDVTEGIESTLVMLGHKLRGGLTVVRDYAPDVPRIEAFPGELNQVWTNLIDNAIDAMGGEGTLLVSTRVEDDDVVVEVGDTGPGMPADVQARAFEPFFTTKDIGKGTGLGLDISRRIVVDRHHGQITIESRPQETVLRVRLPCDRGS
jgi:signal transduction histidine kinase